MERVEIQSPFNSPYFFTAFFLDLNALLKYMKYMKLSEWKNTFNLNQMNFTSTHQKKSQMSMVPNWYQADLSCCWFLPVTHMVISLNQSLTDVGLLRYPYFLIKKVCYIGQYFFSFRHTYLFVVIYSLLYANSVQKCWLCFWHSK